MEYTGKLYGEGGIPLMLTASDVDALESMRCDSGLSVGQMYAAIASFDLAVDALRNRISAPKYIMLEIQRGENDY